MHGSDLFISMSLFRCMELKVTGPVLTIYSLNLSFKKRKMFQILHLFTFLVVRGEDSQITNLSLMQIISNL